jgi:hypothetical protein
MSVLDSIFNYVGKLRYNVTPPTPVDGELVEWQADSTGRLRVDIAATGSTLWSSPGAAVAEKIVKASNGKIYRLFISNPGASTAFVFLFNSAVRPTNGSVAEIVPPLQIPAGGSGEVDFELRPYDATVGIYWGASSTHGTFTYDSGATLLVATEYA